MNYSSWDSNYPQNATQDAWFDSVVTISTALILAIIILITAIGNVFVISVILLERHLQSVANYLILSLAVADLLVACLVMPLGAVYVVTQQQWFLGPALCDMWTSSDVLCCTASILHLVAIAADRYWAVTSVDYIQNRTTKRIVQMIVLIWAISLLISLGPPLGWKDDEWHHRVEVMKNCLVSQDVAYQVFATIATFYLPLAIILFLYWRIFLAAQKRIRRKPHSANNRTSCPSGRLTSSLPAVSLVSETTTTTMMSSSPAQPHCVTFQAEMQRPSAAKRRNVESKRERKAAKTLAIITGAFVICWLPFFVVALLMPLCPESCSFDGHMISFFLWLGYLNSTLNPVLYTIFSPEFRSAFQKLLGINKRMIPGQRGDQLEQRSIAVSNTSG